MTVLAKDNFNIVNGGGVDINGRVLDIGATWVRNLGGIVGDSVNLPDSTGVDPDQGNPGNNNFYFTAVNVADYFASTTVNTTAIVDSTSRAGIIVRAQTSDTLNNFYYAYYQSGGFIKLWKQIGTTSTNLANATTSVNDGSRVLKLTISGKRLTVRWNNTVVINGFQDVAISGSGSAGILNGPAYHDTVFPAMDNFLCDGVGTPVPPPSKMVRKFQVIKTRGQLRSNLKIRWYGFHMGGFIGTGKSNDIEPRSFTWF